MWDGSPERLAQDSGLSVAEAEVIWNRLYLTGFRHWQPWSMLLGTQLVYWSILVSGVYLAAPWLRVFINGVFFVGIICALRISLRLAYPNMLTQAKEQRHSFHR